MPRILIVEDEFLIRLTLAEMLGDEGFEVAEAEDGAQALALLNDGAAIDLLLTDVNLPGQLNGWAVADAARRSRPDLPVLFMSGGAQSPPGRATSPYDAFIQKPYTPSEIAAVAKRMTGQG